MRNVAVAGLILVFCSFALAVLSPRDIIDQLANDMNLVEEHSSYCNSIQESNASTMYPQVDSGLKFIGTFSYTQGYEKNAAKSFVDLGLLKYRDLHWLKAWKNTNGFERRFITDAQDQSNYVFQVNVSDGPKLYTSAICFTVIAFR
jgi:hypothetical protein